ncbi:MAG: hypothetical protein M1822_002177 [Bathelium mastoideum]|nr:MAG: hypothetical protein M1822_002177 [Bathelium mastoideum]
MLSVNWVLKALRGGSAEGYAGLTKAKCVGVAPGERSAHPRAEGTSHVDTPAPSSLPTHPVQRMSDSSSLSSPPLSEDEARLNMKMDAAAKRASIDSSDEAPKSPKRKRPASPPHEEVLADNPDIPVSRRCNRRVLKHYHCLNRV